MFYTLYGAQSNGKVCLPATTQQIIDYCLANPDIAKAIAEQFKESEFQEWKKEVLQEFTTITGIPSDEVENIEDEASIIYNTGLTNIASAANELAGDLLSPISNIKVKPTFRNCVACSMLSKGIKFRKTPTHTCGN